MTATEVARNFSEVLNRVAEGETIEVTRNGAVVAVIEVRRPYVLSAERFRELMRSLPPVDEDFARELREIRGSVEPPEDSWQS
jgi:prevent-host-death family protein